jgi:hypothetical protein
MHVVGTGRARMDGSGVAVGAVCGCASARLPVGGRTASSAPTGDHFADKTAHAAALRVEHGFDDHTVCPGATVIERARRPYDLTFQ